MYVVVQVSLCHHRCYRNEVANYRKRLEATKFEMDTLSKQKEQVSNTLMYNTSDGILQSCLL